MLLRAGQGLPAAHMLRKNCRVLQLLSGGLGRQPEIKGISFRNPGPHLGPRRSPVKTAAARPAALCAAPAPRAALGGAPFRVKQGEFDQRLTRY